MDIKNKENIKAYSDPPAYRIYFSEGSQKIMENIIQNIGEIRKDPQMKLFNKANVTMFNSPTVVYLTFNKGYAKYSILDLGGLNISIMLAAKARGVEYIIAYKLIKYPDVLRNLCKIPENEDFIIGIALGYKEDDILNKFKARKISVDEVCHFYK